MEIQKLLSRKIIAFITLIVTIMPIIALPTMIEGISYVKVFVALTCVMPLIPFMLKKIIEIKDGIVIWILTLSLLLIVVFSVLLIQNDYRGVFGAPGRNNGTLSILLYLCLTIFGIYVYMKDAILHHTSWISNIFEFNLPNHLPSFNCPRLQSLSIARL